MLDESEPGRGDRIGSLRFTQPVGPADVTQQRTELVGEPPPRQFIPCGGTPHEFGGILLGHRWFPLMTGLAPAAVAAAAPCARRRSELSRSGQPGSVASEAS